MVKGKTTKGFSYTISDAAMDDWELLELLTKLDKGEMSVIVDASIHLLGEKQYKNLKNFLRKNGRIKASDFIQEFTEIMTSTKELKN